jgi:hypothetical protein
MTCRCSHLLFREWTERRPTGLVLRSRVHWATVSRLVTGKEKSVANGIDSIGLKGILVLLLLLLLLTTRERERERDQT